MSCQGTVQYLSETLEGHERCSAMTTASTKKTTLNRTLGQKCIASCP